MKSADEPCGANSYTAVVVAATLAVLGVAGQDQESLIAWLVSSRHLTTVITTCVDTASINFQHKND